jgi:hypothetical protein
VSLHGRSVGKSRPLLANSHGVWNYEASPRFRIRAVPRTHWHDGSIADPQRRAGGMMRWSNDPKAKRYGARSCRGLRLMIRFGLRQGELNHMLAVALMPRKQIPYLWRDNPWSCSKHSKVCLASLEMKPSESLYRMLMQAAGTRDGTILRRILHF